MIGWILHLLALCSLLVASPALADPTGPADGWRFRPGDDAAWADPGLGDSGWTAVAVPGAWEAVAPGYDGYGWYRRVVELPPEAADGPVGIRFRRVGDAFEAFWNGVPIGGGGSLPPHFVESVAPELLLVPPHALHRASNGKHVLAVRVYNGYSAGGLLEEVRIARYDVLAGRRSDGDMVMGGLIAFFLAIGAYHLAFFLRRREAPGNLYFALLCGLTVVYGATYMTPTAELMVRHVNPYRLRLLVMLAAGPVYIGLISRLFQLGGTRFTRLAIALFLLLIPLVAGLSLGTLAEIHHFFSALVGAGLVGSIVWVVRNDYQWVQRSRILLAGMVALALAVLWDLLTRHAGAPVPQVLPEVPGAFWIGFLAFVVAVGMETAGSFALAEVHARMDPLTGLARRHVFEEAVAREAERRRRAGGMLILVVLDLDHFKQINDTFGHVAGDRVLERIGHLLRHSARNIDLTARLGGEEFAVLLSDTNEEGALSFTTRLCDRLRELEVPVPGGIVRDLTASFGVAVSTGWADTDALIDAADRAMYASKQAGRDRVTMVVLPADEARRPSDSSLPS